MHPSQQLAEFLVIAWRFGATEERIPTSHGILDRALLDIHDQSLLPEWVANELHFTDSRVGLKCVELPEILEWAQRTQLTSSPNPSYESTAIQISESAARIIASDSGYEEESLKSLGKALCRSVQRAKKEQEEFEQSRIEAY